MSVCKAPTVNINELIPNTAQMHAKWQLITTVKHFCSRRPTRLKKEKDEQCKDIATVNIFAHVVELYSVNCLRGCKRTVANELVGAETIFRRRRNVQGS